MVFKMFYSKEVMKASTTIKSQGGLLDLEWDTTDGCEVLSTTYEENRDLSMWQIQFVAS
jgi:hypothetical protein